ncbi:MAG: hypothetical protein IJ289_00680 [Clostridia bacterium]|nr:hypothetical protein [Clostridia bacterium]
MKSHSRSYEQYCCVKKRNVVIEETAYHDGRKFIRCTLYPECIRCKNKILKVYFDDKNEDTAD